jgi:hypothetical protein
MDNVKLTVGIEVTIKEGKFYFNILAHEDMDTEMIRSVIVGGLSLTIHGEDTPQKQGKALRDVISYLESDFIDIESFNDVHINKINTSSED